MTDDITDRLREWASLTNFHEDREVLDAAADEIERLRAQVAFLLPFAKADAELGATLGPHPNDEYDDCADCQWYEQSMELLQKIEAGEFG